MCFGGVWEGLPLAKLHKRPVCGEALHTRVFCGVFEGWLVAAFRALERLLAAVGAVGT